LAKQPNYAKKDRMRNAVFFLLLLWSVITPVLGAVAQTNSPYTIEDITITMPAGGDITKKREQAVQKATKQAFTKLLQNITPQEEWLRHDDITAIVDWDTILEKFIIVKEETSPEYSLNLNLFFNRNEVRSLLHDLTVPYAESQKLRLLVLPLMDTATRLLLWDEQNPWRDALEQTTVETKLLEFVLPVGDVDEVTGITAEMVNLGAEDVLLNLANQYEADGVIVSRLHTVYDYGNTVLEIENSWYGTKNAKQTKVQYPIQPTEGFEEALLSAAALSYNKLDESWQKSGVIQLDKQGRIFIRYSPSNAADLERLASLLRSFNIVENVELRVLNIKNSLFQINYFGDERDLANMMIEHGLKLSFQGSLWWVSFMDAEQDIHVN
jgi:hypothetical protein